MDESDDEGGADEAPAAEEKSPSPSLSPPPAEDTSMADAGDQDDE